MEEGLEKKERAIPAREEGKKGANYENSLRCAVTVQTGKRKSTREEDEFKQNRK